MQRITRKHLDHYVAELNAITGSPANYWQDGIRKTSIGHYCISGAYGGWELHRISNESGGVHVVSAGGHIPARDLLGQIQTALNVARDIKGN